MDGHLAEYACDRCRSRKSACTREKPACQRCRNENIDTCTYSRAGIIRRQRRKKRHASISPESNTPITINSSTTRTSSKPGLVSHLSEDIETTRDQLTQEDGSIGSEQSPSGALSSLSQACATVWNGGVNEPAIDQAQLARRLYLFEDKASEWTEIFIETMDRGEPLFCKPPEDVLHLLRTARPHAIEDRAWLVMFYSIVLGQISSTEPENSTVKSRLQSNLWYSLNDIRLLLEPSELNVHALILLACHVEEFTTPSLCWMLATNACRMLQTLGVNHRRFDHSTRERRCMMFWHLNLIDKGLAVIFGRPPSFHRAMSKEIPMPTLDQLVSFKPHVQRQNSPAMFGAHFLHQLMLLSSIMGDVWVCLYDDDRQDETTVDKVLLELESWYQNAQKVLQAAAITEKPFLGADSMAAVDIGLNIPTFQYTYLVVLLSRNSQARRARRIDASEQLLGVLENLVSDSLDVFNGVVWQLICCPFTAFLALFGEILSNGEGASAENKEMLSAMEYFPRYLERMAIRNSLAGKLQKVAQALMQHATAVVNAAVSKDMVASTGQNQVRSTHQMSITMPPAQGVNDIMAYNPAMLTPWSFDTTNFDWSSILTTSTGPAQPALSAQMHVGEGISMTEPGTWLNDAVLEPMVDWFDWEHQLEFNASMSRR